MAKVIGSIGMALLVLAGCAESTAPESDAPATVPQVAEAPEANQMEPVRYNEFIWCSNGENATPERVAQRNELWSQSVTALGMDSLMAASLTTQGWTSDSFDRLTLLMWPNKEVRDAGWAAYQESGTEAKLEEQFPGVEKCGGDNWANVYGLDVYQPRSPSLAGPDHMGPDAYVGYSFCSFNEGKAPVDLRAVVLRQFVPFLDAHEAEVGATTYNFLAQVPSFEETEVELHNDVPPTFDFVWTDFWGNAEDRLSTESAWAAEGVAIQAAFDEVATCSERQGYSIEMTKLASS
ncbi:MAG: hypothetical protein VW867_02150 [Gammaproteobacteria bacterium]